MDRTVLYIEDEAFFAKIISSKLEGSGFAVDVAVDGESGLEKLTEKKYDVVLLDLVLPKGSGFDVLEQLQSLEKNKNTPVIILSNLSSGEDTQKAKDLGARGFYVKVNSTPNEIVTLVKGIVGQN